MSKEGRKEFIDTKCRMCKLEEETCSHIWACTKARKKIRLNIVNDLEEWKEKLGCTNRDWSEVIREAITEKPIKEICKYAIEIEKIIREGNGKT